MKARTREEKKVLCLSNGLKPIGERVKQWAYEHCFDKVGFYKKSGEIWCQCCGKRSHVHLSVWDKHRYKCPGCGKTIELTYYRGKALSVATCFTLFQTHKEYQVIRTFEVLRENRKCENHTTHYNCREIWQSWINDKGKETLLGLDYQRSPYYFNWDYYSQMNVKKHNGSCSGYYAYGDIFDLYGNIFYPRGRFTKLLQRNGWTVELLKRSDIDVVPLMQSLIKMDDAFVEELVKHRQYGILSYVQKVGRDAEGRKKWQHAVRICERNGYIVEDASLYVDYIDLLEYFGLDTHNAKYVCPADLPKAHDRLLKRKERIEEKKRIEAEREKLQEMDMRYKSHIQAFMGVQFGNRDIQIAPLRNVEEFLEEGIAMHHCVYAMSYYDVTEHPNSLIMSAKDRNGKRLETIEVDTTTWKVVQSRGVCNQSSPYHDEIIKIVTNYMPMLMRVASVQK